MIAILFIIIVGTFVLNATNRSDNLFQGDDKSVDDNLNADTLNTSNRLSGSIDHQEATQINPATGFPMYGGVDAMGNAYGMSSFFDNHHDMFNDSFNSSFSSFDDSFSSFNSFDSFNDSSF